MINKINKKVLYREILDYVMIAVGMLSYAIGWMVFLLPNHIGNGGVAGLASILNWGQGIPVANTYFVLNAILLAIALKVLGLKFCIRTIYGRCDADGYHKGYGYCLSSSGTLTWATFYGSYYWCVVLWCWFSLWTLL